MSNKENHPPEFILSLSAIWPLIEGMLQLLSRQMLATDTQRRSKSNTPKRPEVFSPWPLMAVVGLEI